MPLAQQSQLILREYCNDAVLRERAKMWSAAATELPQVSKDFLSATHKAKDAEWDKDDVGTQFLAKSAQTQKVIDDWEKRVTAAKPAEALERVAALIKPTYEKVQQAVQGYNNEVKTATNAEQIRAIELKWRQVAGAAMNILGKAASESAQTMQQLVGAPEWRGVSDAAPTTTDTGPTGPNNRTSTGPAGPTANTGPQNMAPNMEKTTAPVQQNPQTAPPGTPTGTPPGSPTGTPTGGSPTGSSDPQLSGGLGSAPQIPTPTVPQLPGAGTPTIPGGGAPLIPPLIPPAGAASGIGVGGGGRPIGGGGSGIRVPGVSLGGGVGGVGGVGGGSIPVAGAASATPVNQMPTATGPSVSALGAAGGTTSAGSAMPPMMPPMGAAGAGAGIGGGGGTPGSGAAKRAAPGRGRARDGRTPGLVGPLSGKAGKADPNAFAARNRRETEESDIPSTVQLIDEDLWQVEQRTPATRH